MIAGSLVGDFPVAVDCSSCFSRYFDSYFCIHSLLHVSVASKQVQARKAWELLPFDSLAS